MIRYASSEQETRPDVVAAAVAITAAKRYVPNQVCLTCMVHVYYELHGRLEGHDVVPLTRAERDEVARIHKAASDAEWEGYKAKGARK